ncbi:MAG: hypothetical protein ACREX3_22705, partial [Gammaproteobacteria bacterium]
SMTQPSSPRLVAPAPLRFVTATSIFDGHDAAINIIRRLLRSPFPAPTSISCTKTKRWERALRSATMSCGEANQNENPASV